MQMVVEKRLKKTQNLSRHDVGREKFVELAFEWKDQYQSKIYNQLRRLGSSYDWDRAAFTMEPKVRDASFIKEENRERRKEGRKESIKKKK